eukprot:6133363-Amphidinium_carterae.1
MALCSDFYLIFCSVVAPGNSFLPEPTIRELRCDASPWGGGGQAVAKWSMTWTVQLAQILQLDWL